MKWGFSLCLMLAAMAVTPSAHVAFSSVDVRVNGAAIEVTVVAQAFDLAHELGIDPPEKLVDLAFLESQQAAIGKVIASELDISAGGSPLAPGTWSAPAAAPDQQLIRLRTTYDASGMPGRVDITSRLFSYDTAHQTLVNVYEGDALKTQQILDASRVRFEYFTSTRAGFWSIARRFSLAGLQRALSGYDLLLFAIALVLLGGTIEQLALIGLAFTLSYTLGLWAGASNGFPMPLAVVAPVVALSVVYAGVDNLMAGGRRDVRVWIALGFGWAHGFNLAGALAAIDRPVQRFAWAVASFNAGLEAGLVLAVAGTVALLALPAPRVRARIATALSIAVAAAGVLSFVQRTL